MLRFKEIVRQRDFRLVLVDLLMVFVLLVNLLYIIFEFNFETPIVNNFIFKTSPTFHAWYDAHLHQNFLFYDSIFVAIFLTELFIRWGLAIYRKTYSKWFFYPFVHWYDVLGCIPLGAFRALRFIRLISITIRLNKLKVITIKEWQVYKIGIKYLNIVTEEVSDRVVVNVINGIQKEVDKGGVTTDRIIESVILPQKPFLVEWLAQRLEQATAKTQLKLESELKIYIDEKVKAATKRNAEMGNLKYLPIAGKAVQNMLEAAISDITFNVINGIIKDIAEGKNQEMIEDVTNVALDALILNNEQDKQLEETIKNMVQASLEIVKEQVEIKQWKQVNPD